MRFVIIGSGNVAWNLANALFYKGFKIVQIMSRNLQNAKILAEKLNSDFTDNLDNIAIADIYLICTSDNAIESVAEKLQNKVLVHCSGSVSIDILRKYTEKCGVLYPLYSFKKHNEIDFNKIPLLIEASDDLIFRKLNEIAEKLTNYVVKVNSEQRLNLHISAVFINNFVNHIFYLSQKIAQISEIDQNLLLPLLMQTCQINGNSDFFAQQTGPARRFDDNTTLKHFEILNKIDSNIAEVYKVLTNSIVYTYFGKKIL